MEETQIEKMAYEMTQYKETVCKRLEDNECLLRFHPHAFINCHFCKLAEHLITEKDYRKASDVAREIFAELKDKYIGCFFDGRRDVIVFRENDLAELEKKYESEDGERKDGNER